MSITFKQFVIEAKILTKGIDYSEPPPRGKFQEGDIVLVRGDNRWKKYQPRYSDPYENKVGVVVGYRNVPGAYSKFAIKFPNGDIAMFHSHYIYGPFKDVKTAEKYTDPNIQISPSEIITKAKTSKLTDFQTRPEIEAYLKKFVPKLGYKWLSTPKQVLSYNSTHVYTILAEMDMQNSTGKPEYADDHPIKNKYSVFRINKISSNKLKAGNTNIINNIVSNSSGGWGNNIGYYIEAPVVNKKTNITSDNFFTVRAYGVPNELNINESDIINYFNTYHEKIKMINEGSLNSDLGFIKTVFDVKGNTIFGNIEYHYLNLKDPYFFRPYKIKGNFEAYLINGAIPQESISQIHDFTFTPREVTGELKIYSSDDLGFKTTKGITQKTEDLELINLGLASLEGGLPEVIPGNFVISNMPITNFIGAPKQVSRFIFNQLELTSLKGIPRANNYVFYNTTLNGKQVEQKDIDHELLKGEMSPNALKTFSDFMDEL